MLCSACDTHPSVSLSPRPAPSAAAAGPGFCDAASADPPGTCGLMIRMAAQINVTTRKQEQFLLLGLLPFVLGLCFPHHTVSVRCLSPCLHLSHPQTAASGAGDLCLPNVMGCHVDCGNKLGFRKKSVKMNLKGKTYK